MEEAAVARAISGGSARDDMEEEDGGEQRREEEEDEVEEEEAVYCAVGKEAGKEWKANLIWVLASFPRRRRIFFIHVHRPPSRVNMMGAWVPVSQLAEEEVNAYRQLEKEKISKVLDDLLDICKSQKVNASKIIFSCDDIVTGLLRLIDDHGITELVMGAASDKAYSRKMRAPRCKKAQKVQLKASPSCKIWFVCKGNLICTREVNEGLNRTGSSTTSTSPRSSTSDYSRSRSSPRVHSLSSDPFSMMDSAEPTTSSVDQTPIREDNAMNKSTEGFNHETTAVASSSAVPVSENVEAEQRSAAAVVQSLQQIEEDPPTPSGHGSEDAGDTGDAYDKLKDAVIEAENLRHEAYEETRRRQKAERDLADATRIANEAESSHQREARHRKEVEERLARERAAMEQERRELDDVIEQTRKADARAAELELQIANSERMMSHLEAKLSESYGLLHQLRRDLRRDNPAATAAGEDGGESVSFLRLGLSELEEATKHFDESVRIGGGVYRGELRGMAVAVKVIGRDVAVDEVEFCRQVEAISRARHPGLVALVGACPEARAVVHELVPGGSLEDRLAVAGAPLPWHALCGVAHRTCSALAFLHSTATVHGDVRPANILLDEECCSSKLASLGMRRLVRRHTGGAALARPATAGYVDPRRGEDEMTPERDVHALGVVLLRLVTGKPPFTAKKEAREASGGSKRWHEVVDASSGWPVDVASEVALVGLKLCEVSDSDSDSPAGARRLLEEAIGVLEAAMSAAPGRSWSSVSSSDGGEGGAPAYFVCPILKEVMRDPQIAGDGFSYEAEAIREWLRSGRDTSPMTNLKLPRRELVPNIPLRDAIHDWRLRRAMRNKSTGS